jgi:hypothetical protein
MKNRNTKKQQRFVNWLINLMNKNLKEDNMYKGCFQIKQIDRYTRPYCDGSGESEFMFKVAFIGTKTNEVITTSGWIRVFGTDKGNRLQRGTVSHKIFEFVNDGIIKDANFWENKEKWL